MYKHHLNYEAVCWLWVGRCLRRSLICLQVCFGTRCATCCTGRASASGWRCRQAGCGAVSLPTTSDCRQGMLRSSTWNCFSFISLVRCRHLKHGHVWQGPDKPGFFKKPNLLGFLGFIGFWALLGCLDFLFEQAVGKLVGWFSSSAKLSFRFASTSDYLKISKFITYWSLEAVNLKKSLIITGTTNWNWIKFGAGFLLGFSMDFIQKTWLLFWVLPRCLNPELFGSGIVQTLASRACGIRCTSNVPTRGAGTSTPKGMTTGKNPAQ